ncbi:hypothetical protein [Streptomyces fagopyri]|uniref:hypothetical protein n=1 Tax=Streptomyces fagopyri TaxID=2662397 RepID=UPI0037FF4F63
MTTPAQAAPAAVPPRLGDAPQLPSRSEAVAVLGRVADHWTAARPDPGDNGWANATFFG